MATESWSERRKKLYSEIEQEDETDNDYLARKEKPDENSECVSEPALYISRAKRRRMEIEALKNKKQSDATREENLIERKTSCSPKQESENFENLDKFEKAQDQKSKTKIEESQEEEEEEEEAPKPLSEPVRTKEQYEEERLLKEASQIQTNALQAKTEVAQGTLYKTPLRTSWKVPSYILREESNQIWTKRRKKWNIIVEGHDIPPPLTSFEEMKLPFCDKLKSAGIQKPTPIQIQGLPVALARRDMVGIAFTGSGKTLTFVLPLIMLSLEEEQNMPLVGGEGPVGVLLAPSRELARQTFDVLQKFSPPDKIRNQLLIGGEDPRTQYQTIQSLGVHGVVATPGRIRDFLKRQRINFQLCRYICLDEADRMLDLGFDEEVSEIMNYFPHQRQTLLFSATFPQTFREFAMQTLVKPIIVNVGRAGAANLDVIQEVEYVKQEAKIVYLLECLQKTAPPVVIFCEKKGDVDDIHEYLLLKGVEAVSIHGSKGQEERNEAIQLYKEGKKDVLVATDVAAKGLDFANIQHVINFDMPSEIENYIHRIGRTGRCGKTGVATTFINKSCSETTLLDLKHLLIEAKQRVPPVLMVLEDRDTHRGNTDNVQRKEGGCSFCGGLGHSVLDCPKIEKVAGRIASGNKDVIASSGGGYAGNW